MRYALRSLARKPSYALTAILTVALGVGANAAVFRVIYAVLIQPLPFRDPAKLVRIWETHPALAQLQATVPDFEDWRARTHSFDQIAAHTLSAMNTATLLGRGDPEIIHATMASHELFPTMGIEPMLGRTFDGSEEGAKLKVGLISEDLWRRKFGADASIIGQQIRLDNQSFTVIGVVSRRQAFPAWADFWMPLSLIEPDLQNRRKYHPLEVVARLKPGVDAEHAQADVQGVARELAREHPDTNGTIGAFVIPLAFEITGSVRPSLLLVWAAVGLVFLIACANLAHLFLARMQERRSEMAIREALGATAWQLIRQVLKETLMLAGIGGLAGAGLAAWAGELLSKLAQNQIPRMEESAFNGPVWLFTILVAIACGVLFGLPVCWQILARPNRRAGGRSVTRGGSRFGLALMAAEVALAFVVLTGAALLTRSFAALLDENPGFQAENVLAMDVQHLNPRVNPQVIPALRSIPGIEAAAGTNSAPMTLLPSEHSRWATRFGLEGRKFGSGQYPATQIRFVTPEYFSVLSIPLKRGRVLNEADSAADLKTPRFVVNETFARRFLAAQEPIGKRLILGVMDPQQTPVEIVGVVGDTHDFGLDQEVEPTIYTGGSGDGTLLIRTAGSPAAFESAVRQEIRRLDPQAVMRQVRPLQQNVSDSLARRRFALSLLLTFGALAAILTAAGIYGLLAYSVNLRVREFGVRAAVGATPGDLVTMILREAAALTLPGLAIGVILSLAFARVMKSFVFQLSATDPWSILSAGVFLALAALISAWLPARRAAATELGQALKTE
jgi:putative ABC transport system permease protein